MDVLSAYLAAEGWTTSHRTLSGGRNGYSDPEGRPRRDREPLSPEHAAKTMIHETAHVLMGTSTTSLSTPSTAASWKTRPRASPTSSPGRRFRHQRLQRRLRRRMGSGDVDLIRGTAARVLATAHQIAAVLDPRTTTHDEDAAA